MILTPDNKSGGNGFNKKLNNIIEIAKKEGTNTLGENGSIMKKKTFEKHFKNIESFEKKLQKEISDLEIFLENNNNKKTDNEKDILLKNIIKSLQNTYCIKEKLQQIYNTFKSPEAKRLEKLNQVFSLDKYVFFLGGMDSEMAGIQKILDKENLKYHSKKLNWGAKVSNYDEEIIKCVSNGLIPVFIELEGAENIPGSINIDHHGDFTDKDPSIIQSLFGIIYRKEVLLGVNDAEYIGGLIKNGATEEEINALREIDRIHQGITQDEEKEGLEAIKRMERFEDLEDLIIIRMNHSKIATITDRLFSSQYNKKGQNILIISKDQEEINYVADNKINLINELKKKFGGWVGGKEPNKYWGVNRQKDSNMPKQEEIVEFIKKSLKK